MLSVLIPLIFATRSVQAIFSDDYYTAAVLEHVKEDDPRNRSESILKNLANYHRAAGEALAEGADIIVFPESGIMPSMLMTSRYMKQYYEEIPDPKTIDPWEPCSQSLYATDCDGTGTPVIMRLSCIAKEFGLYLVANVGEKVLCSPENSTECPPKIGALFYNTDVVFDGSGKLVARHRKRFPYFEMNISRPKLPEYTWFNTSFGSFGVIICFDTVFSEAVELVEKFKVENVIISTWWFDELPLMPGIGYFQGWALGNKVNVLAANIHQPRTGSIGSLIISRHHGVLNYTFKPNRVSSELLIAKVPRKATFKPKVIEITDPPNLEEYRHKDTDMSNYTLVKLEHSNGEVVSCQNGLCCNLTYTSETVPKDFYLAAYNGITNIKNHYFFCQEICAVVLCANEYQCKPFPTHSQVVFNSLVLNGNISTPHQYPIVLTSELTLVPISKWNFELGRIQIKTGSVQNPLLFAGIHGRCYNRDPPFPEK